MYPVFWFYLFSTVPALAACYYMWKAESEGKVTPMLLFVVCVALTPFINLVLIVVFLIVQLFGNGEKVLWAPLPKGGGVFSIRDVSSVEHLLLVPVWTDAQRQEVIQGIQRDYLKDLRSRYGWHRKTSYDEVVRNYIRTCVDYREHWKAQNGR